MTAAFTTNVSESGLKYQSVFYWTKAMKTTQKPDPVYLVGGAIVLGILAFNAPVQIATMQQQRHLAQQISQANQEAQIKARLANADSERRSQLAQERFKAGCQMTVASNSPNKFAAIQQGKPVLDATTGAPLGDGVVVCSMDGNTAVIRNGVAQDLAFSSDRQVIRDAMKRYDGVQYAAPQQ
jgi:hypothetical protein